MTEEQTEQAADKPEPAAPAPADEHAHGKHAQDDDHPAPAWEAELDVYPLGEAEGDPGWAIKTVKVWIAIGVGAIIFIFWLLFMGLVYD